MTTRLTLLLLLALLVACGSKEGSGPPVVPGEPAGDVREVTGTVTAQRGDEPARTLAVGDVVAGDDLIATAADSSIVIELRHNGVRWSLAADRSRRLGDSAAWKAPRRSGEGGATGERSTAAGRHAEREAADTASSDTEAAAPAAEAAAVTAAPPPPAPDPAPAAEKVALEDPAPPREEKKDVKSRSKPSGGGSIGTGGGGSTGSGGGTGDGYPPRPVVEPPEGSVRIVEVLPTEAKRTVATRRAVLRHCWQKAVDQGAKEGLLHVRLTVDPDGKVTEVIVGKAAGDVDRALDCLKTQLGRIIFSATPDTTVSIKATFGTD